MNNKVQFSCEECKSFSQNLTQNNNFKYYWIRNCITFTCRLFAARKKCQGKYFEKTKRNKKIMKVLKMISWKDAKKYPKCSDQNNFKDFWDCVKLFLRNNNIKVNGSWHQNWKYGVPLIEAEGKLFAFTVSMRRWGKLMAEAFEPENKDPLVYINWAFSGLAGVKDIVDENKNPLS